MIPQGAHYITYSLEDENHMFKVGIFVYIKPGDVNPLIITTK